MYGRQEREMEVSKVQRQGRRNCLFKSQVYDGLKNKCLFNELSNCTYQPHKNVIIFMTVTHCFALNHHEQRKNRKKERHKGIKTEALLPLSAMGAFRKVHFILKIPLIYPVHQ